MPDQNSTREPRRRVQASSHLIQILPREWRAIGTVLAPAYERFEPADAATRVVIVTSDSDSAVAIAEAAFAHFGAQGVDVFAATSARRAARLLRTDPARVIAGPPWVLKELLETSALRLDAVQTVVLAWVDDLLAAGGAPAEDLETVMAETPREAVRVMLAREMRAESESFAERHLHRARRVGTAGAFTVSDAPVSFVAAGRTARPAALRRALDELDPPSAAVVVESEAAEIEARAAIRQLGYRRSDDVVRVVRGPLPANVHTAILYDAPVNAERLRALSAARPTTIVALVEPSEVADLRRITGGLAAPLVAGEAVASARRHEDRLRAELRVRLAAGGMYGETGVLEPLLAEHDALEIAAVLLRMLAEERARQRRPPDAHVARGPRGAGGPRGSQRPERGRDDRPPRGAPPFRRREGR